MSKLARLSFTIEEDLMKKMSRLTKRAHFKNRSEFIRDLIRSRLVGLEWERDAVAIGTITLVYDHDTWRVSDELTQLQNKHHNAVLAATHVHRDNHLCAEMIMVKGRAHLIEELSELLSQQKGCLALHAFDEFDAKTVKIEAIP